LHEDDDTAPLASVGKLFFTSSNDNLSFSITAEKDGTNNPNGDHNI
jgi:hypothetical protein